MGTRREEFLTAIVDDESALREAIESLLNSAGFRTESFASADDFLRSTRVESTGCLILDIALSGMGGLELQRHLIDIGLHFPIVFITAQEDRNGRLRSQALQGGALSFLHKPFGDLELLSAVHSARKLNAASRSQGKRRASFGRA
jgi:two-component system response regulator FixJ